MFGKKTRFEKVAETAEHVTAIVTAVTAVTTLFVTSYAAAKDVAAKAKEAKKAV